MNSLIPFFFDTNLKLLEIVDDEIKFIHSSTSSGVIISSTKENYYARSFVQVNLIILV